MSELPYNLYRAEQVREMDGVAMAALGIPPEVLMERAGAALMRTIYDRWPALRRLAVVCGAGNNGGDGYVAARLAHEAGVAVTVYQLGDAGRVQGAALAALQRLRDTGLSPQPFNADGLGEVELVIDAIFGTGLDREVQGAWRDAIEAINRCTAPVLAADIPSGLHADTGRALGAAVRAAVTVTFIGAKQGMFTGSAPDHCGDIVFDDLEVPAATFAGMRPAAFRITYSGLNRLLRPRPRAAHKGSFGHVLVVGGDHGTAGAARMAGEAALRTGAGLVSVATRSAHAALVSALRPELMAHGVESAAGLRRVLRRATVLALGPGLGTRPWGRRMFDAALDCDMPLVVDADALNLLAQAPRRCDRWILTPHPGEAGRLLGRPAAEVQADRFAAVTELHRRFGGVCILKGAGTLIYDGNGPVDVCAAGNPGMASGGMGDALTGIVAGLTAQGLPLTDAARLAVCLHAEAGDRAARGGERGLVASDLIKQLRALVNPPAV